jgi:hypothetical protein
MTVSATKSRKEYAGDGSTTSFATNPVVFFDAADLTVYVVTTATGVVAATLVLNTDYTVSGGDGSTGTVDLSTGSDPYGAPSALQTLVIVRELGITQASNLVNNDGSDAEVVEKAFDRLTMIAQELNARLDRAFTLADSDVSGASTVIPTPVANTIIGWNSDGDALQNYVAADIAPDILVSTFMETLLDDVDAATARSTLGLGTMAVETATDYVAKSVFTTKGDILAATAASTPARLAVGSDGTIPMARSAASSGLAYVGALRSYISGLVQSQAADTDHDITISAGGAMSSDNAYWLDLSSAITKRIDAAWAVGTNQGGLDGSESVAGTPDASTWYYIWLIARSDTGVVDALFSESSSSPTMPTNYDFKRLIGAVRTDGSANIVAFVARETSGGGIMVLNTALQGYVSKVDVSTTASLMDVVAPLLTGAVVKLTVAVIDTGAAAAVYLSSPLVSDEAVATTTGVWNAGSGSSGDNSSQSGQMDIETETSQVRARSSLASTRVDLATRGWEWSRR